MMTPSERRHRIARTLLLLRRSGRLQRRRRIPRQRFPFTIEVEYAKRLVKIVTDLRDAVSYLKSELPRLLSVGGDASLQRVRTMLAALRGREHNDAYAARLASEFAHRVVKHTLKEFDRQVLAALGVDLAALGVQVRFAEPRADAANTQLQGFVHENVALIKSLQNQAIDDVESTIMRAFTNGDRWETLAAELEKRFGIAESRARLIARDQIGKLNAQVGRAAIQEIGGTQFRWVSMRDKAVRPTHESKDRQSQAPNPPWDYPGQGPRVPGVMPGQDVSCRCHDEPVFDDILAELDRLEA